MVIFTRSRLTRRWHVHDRFTLRMARKRVVVAPARSPALVRSASSPPIALAATPCAGKIRKKPTVAAHATSALRGARVPTMAPEASNVLRTTCGPNPRGEPARAASVRVRPACLQGKQGACKDFLKLVTRALLEVAEPAQAPLDLGRALLL